MSISSAAKILGIEMTELRPIVLNTHSLRGSTINQYFLAIYGPAPLTNSQKFDIVELMNVIQHFCTMKEIDRLPIRPQLEECCAIVHIRDVDIFLTCWENGSFQSIVRDKGLLAGQTFGQYLGEWVGRISTLYSRGFEVHEDDTAGAVITLCPRVSPT